MKKILLALFCLPGLILPGVVRSQSFTQADTVWASVSGVMPVQDYITVTGAGSLNIKYHVTACNFPADWRTATAFGICDEAQCRYNVGDTFLWNAATSSGPSFTATYPSGPGGTFSLSLDLSSATTTGCFYLTALVSEATGVGGTSKPTTFMICKPPLSVTNLSTGDDKVALYPNPATNELNVVYDANSDTKNIAVYNIIGKVMSVYKVNGDSANLNLENIPSGIYFVRLVNSHGNVVATRKFTKQ